MDKLVLSKSSITLSTENKSILKARKSKKLKDCSKEEIKAVITYIWALIGENLRKIPDFEGPLFLVVYNSLLRALPHLRIDELRIAFEMAVDQKFECNLSLYNRSFNSEYMIKIVNQYLEYRKPALKLESKLLEAPEEVLTEIEKNEKVNQGILKAYENYKESKIMPPVCAWMYTELEASGRIIHSVEFKNEILVMAKEKLYNTLEALKTNKNFMEIKEILKKQQNIDCELALKTEARQIGLQIYWDEQIKKGL